MMAAVYGEKQEFGCEHYRRKCSFVSPCCSHDYTCRVCHDDKEDHILQRSKVTEVICLQCHTRQEVADKCKECKVLFGEYFCAVCRLYDDTDKGQYHCDGCGLCRIGGRENFFHCDRCAHCLSTSLKEEHKCIENVSKANCPVCMEELHSSRLALSVPSCGHMLHTVCRQQMLSKGNTSCPICCVSMVDMSEVWRAVDVEVNDTPMPDEYRDIKLPILCRDCHKESKVPFHIVGLKCEHCGSYNTCGTADTNSEEETANMPERAISDDDEEVD